MRIRRIKKPFILPLALLLLSFFSLYGFQSSKKAAEKKASKKEVTIDEKNWEAVPLPRLPAGPVKLSVVYAVNSRFSKMTPRQINLLLSEAQKVSKEHFNVNVLFDYKGEINLEKLVSAHLPQNAMRQARSLIYDFKNRKGDKSLLIENMEAVLREKKTVLHEMFDFARPYLVRVPKKETYPTLAKALVETTLARLEEWKSVTAKDGKPVIDKRLFNEYVLWDLLAYGHLPYDIVLTNQLIASAEYYGQDIHSAIRGGITGGGTTYNKDSRYGTYIFFTTFLYSNDYKTLLKLRDNKKYDDQSAARYAGAYLSHEIGHLLFHFGHPYGKKECVMNPAELLKFHEWYGNINARGCKIGSNDNMKPGAISITYNPAW